MLRENKKKSWRAIFREKAEALRLKEYIVNLILGIGILLVIHFIYEGDVYWQPVLPVVIVATIVHSIFLFFKWNWKI
ncbi:hypothetical protein DZB84_16110 [Bacillus sp. HNG]|uniref:hypothetical protein n=1 Tax=Bacillus sp. HNG TaxID=2293325 RepID=UPI000E2F2DA6|nr:hypothetical protein [Bacillus sp. HNG]RFB13498.1 hypothetical protein DZB84_16110 [Bacillus sp. HNG]